MLVTFRQFQLWNNNKKKYFSWCAGYIEHQAPHIYISYMFLPHGLVKHFTISSHVSFQKAMVVSEEARATSCFSSTIQDVCNSNHRII